MFQRAWFALAVGSWVFSGLVTQVCAQPRFDPVSFDAGRPSLVLQGEVGTNYVIESSFDLTHWWVVLSGVATNGRLGFLHAAAAGVPYQYYRARAADPPAIPPLLSVQVDTNTTATTLANIDGGNCVLYGNNGVRFTLTVPSNTLPDPRVITMTVVTNLGGLPLARPPIGVVQLLPEDLELLGAAALEITYPTNLDTRQIISFACANDGSGFRLSPDRVRSNHIVIPLTRLGTVGAGLATTQELAAIAPFGRAALAAAATSPRHGGRRGLSRHDFLTSSTECFPDRIEHARAVRDSLLSLQRARESDLAVVIAIERQRQLVGFEDSWFQSIVEEAASEVCPFYENQIAPHWAQATDNCALNTVLLQFTLGFERQLQLLGATTSSECTALQNQPLCPGFFACLEEIKQCCESGRKGPGKVSEVLSLVRQQALLGISCFGMEDSRVKETIEACTSNVWYGSLTVRESGSTNSVTLYANGQDINVDRHTLTYEGEVWESQELDFGPGGLSVNLTFVGNMAAHDLWRRTAESYQTCGTYSFIQQSDLIANANTRYVGYINIQTNGTYTILASHFDQTSPVAPFAPAVETNTETTRTPSCISEPTVRTHVQRSDDYFLGRSTPATPPAGGTTDYPPQELSGSVRFVDPTGAPAIEVTVSWNLQRRPSAEP